MRIEDAEKVSAMKAEHESQGRQAAVLGALARDLRRQEQDAWKRRDDLERQINALVWGKPAESPFGEVFGQSFPGERRA